MPTPAATKPAATYRQEMPAEKSMAKKITTKERAVPSSPCSTTSPTGAIPCRQSRRTFLYWLMFSPTDSRCIPKVKMKESLSSSVGCRVMPKGRGSQALSSAPGFWMPKIKVASTSPTQRTTCHFQKVAPMW